MERGFLTAQEPFKFSLRQNAAPSERGEVIRNKNFGYGRSRRYTSSTSSSPTQLPEWATVLYTLLSRKNQAQK